MGKKGYNWRARHAPVIEIDNESTKQIAVEIGQRQDNYDECNTLVLPSQKRKTINKDKKQQNVKLLSKKHRKQLEKVLERKQKKLRRATLLEDLAKVQATPEELQKYVSITTIQTKGLKRHLKEENAEESQPKFVDNIDESTSNFSINGIKGSKRRRLLHLQNETKKKSSSDPNVVGFEESESSSAESSEDEDSNEKNAAESKEDASSEEIGRAHV